MIDANRLMSLEQWRESNPSATAEEWAREMLERLAVSYRALQPLERMAVRSALEDANGQL